MGALIISKIRKLLFVQNKFLQNFSNLLSKPKMKISLDTISQDIYAFGLCGLEFNFYQKLFYLFIEQKVEV